MLKIRTIIPILVLAGIYPNTEAAQLEENSVSAPPISKYSQDVQEIAEQLMGKSWLVKWRFNKVKSRLQYWQGLAEQCDNFNDVSEQNYNVRACRNFARSMSDGRTSWYYQHCDKLKNWQIENTSKTKQILSGGNIQDPNLTLAAEAAISQLKFEVESVCSTWLSGHLSPQYAHLVMLMTIDGRPSTVYLDQRMNDRNKLSPRRGSYSDYDQSYPFGRGDPKPYNSLNSELYGVIEEVPDL